MEGEIKENDMRRANNSRCFYHRVLPGIFGLICSGKVGVTWCESLI